MILHNVKATAVLKMKKNKTKDIFFLSVRLVWVSQMFGFQINKIIKMSDLWHWVCEVVTIVLHVKTNIRWCFVSGNIPFTVKEENVKWHFRCTGKGTCYDFIKLLGSLLTHWWSIRQSIMFWGESDMLPHFDLVSKHLFFMSFALASILKQ